MKPPRFCYVTPSTRNRGTLGGCIAYAHPCAEIPAVMLALPDDMELRQSRVWVRGTERSLSVAEIGMKAYWHKLDLPPGMESGLEGNDYLVPKVMEHVWKHLDTV